jgi:hypothetical protein
MMDDQLIECIRMVPSLVEVMAYDDCMTSLSITNNLLQELVYRPSNLKNGFRASTIGPSTTDDDF